MVSLTSFLPSLLCVPRIKVKKGGKSIDWVGLPVPNKIGYKLVVKFR